MAKTKLAIAFIDTTIAPDPHNFEVTLEHRAPSPRSPWITDFNLAAIAKARGIQLPGVETAREPLRLELPVPDDPDHKHPVAA